MGKIKTGSVCVSILTKLERRKEVLLMLKIYLLAPKTILNAVDSLIWDFDNNELYSFSLAPAESTSSANKA